MKNLFFAIGLTLAFATVTGAVVGSRVSLLWLQGSHAQHSSDGQ